MTAPAIYRVLKFSKVRLSTRFLFGHWSECNVASKKVELNKRNTQEANYTMHLNENPHGNRGTEHSERELIISRNAIARLYCMSQATCKNYFGYVLK